MDGTMQTILAFLVTAVAGYFLGCFNGAVIVSKYILRDDVRTHGSGNAGLTNFHRTFGGPLTFVVILCDVLKAVIAVLIGAALIGGALRLDTAFAASLLEIGIILRFALLRKGRVKFFLRVADDNTVFFVIFLRVVSHLDVIKCHSYRLDRRIVIDERAVNISVSRHLVTVVCLRIDSRDDIPRVDLITHAVLRYIFPVP